MPVCLRTDKTFKFALPGDVKLPAKDRPHFVAKHVSAGKRLDYIESLDQMDRKDLRGVDAKLNELIPQLVVGVVNMGDVTLEKLIPELTNDEKWDLVYGVLHGNEMSEDDIKN